MRVAIVGCCHGELNLMYQKILESNKANPPVNLVLVTGDFQAVRNQTDLDSMSVPQKYLRFGDFRDYYEGRKEAPILTVFIGGNHEASNYMKELYYGGWVCPNIYYLGSAGVVNVGGLRIAGLSGIYAPMDYSKGYYERLPVTDYREKKTIYHYRDIDVWRLEKLKQPVDIFLSHDWPQGIWEFGDKSGFLRAKPFLKSEIANNQFGSPPLMSLMDKLQPRFWFASHMHCEFEAQYNSTYFKAFNKCVRGRDFFDLINVSPKASCDNNLIRYDAEWLSIIKSTENLVSRSFCRHGPFNDAVLSDHELDEKSLGCNDLDSSIPIAQATAGHYHAFMQKFGLETRFNYTA